MKELFSPPSHALRAALLELPKALEAAFPMQAKHRRFLPMHIEELSRLLTSERGERGLTRQSYWSAPRFTAAYVWYFLPWNMVRLARLLQGLALPEPTPLPLKKGGVPVPRLMADMGSGPLSFPLALWAAKPEWRHIPLTILCMDSAIQPLNIGQAIFTHLAGEQCPWRIVPIRASLEQVAYEVHKADGVPWLLTAANVCNELRARQGQSVEERLHGLMEKYASVLHGSHGAQMLMVEPGTRLGGKTMVSLREAALDCDLVPLGPCPHDLPCPLEESRTWCHFTFDTSGSPAWLKELSSEAHLRKDALSLSFLFLQSRSYAEYCGDDGVKEVQDTYKGRIISAPLTVPSLLGRARYACYDEGLALVAQAEALPSGGLVTLKASERVRTDAKSGARILEHDERVFARESFASHTRASQGEWTCRDERGSDERRYDKDTRGHLHPSGVHPSGVRPSESRPREKEQKRKKPVKPSKKTQKKFWER